MTTQIKRRRGTTTQHSSFTGAEGELTIDTTKDTVVVHDGITSGGHPLAKESSITGKVDKAGDTMTGDLGLSGADVTFGDNDKAIFGAGSDLQIYHEGNHSFIKDTGTGDLKIQATNFWLQNAAGSKNSIRAVDGAEVNLYYNSALKLATTSTGVDITGTLTSDGLTVDGGATIDKGTGSNALSLKASTDTARYYTLGVDTTSDFVIREAFANATRLSIDGPTGDISFYEDTGTTPKFFWDASAESLGIGTSSPTAALDVRRVDTDGAIAEFHQSDGYGFTLSSSQSVASIESGYLQDFVFKTGSTATERMRITSSGSVGIGTSSPSSYNSKADDLVVQTSGDTGMTIVSAASSEGALAFANGTSGSGPLRGRIRYTHSTDEMDFRVNNAEAMRIDSSGNVGIGTSSPSSANALNRVLNIDVPSSEKAGISLSENATNRFDVFFDGSDNSAHLYNSASGGMRFYGTGTERMRIDASGNLLVGKTANNLTDDGIVLRGTGELFVTRANDVAAFNRRSSDGDIVTFRKDGTTVGSIGTSSSSIYTATGDTGLLFFDSGDAILPFTTSLNTRDAAVDLGRSATRFKDLYLSGGVYLGGTGSANKLDDYEEGTWTPTIAQGGFSSTTGTAYYTKIGRVVNVIWEGQIVGTGTSAYFQIGGLPFSATTWSAGSMYTQNYTDEGSQLLTAAVRSGGTSISFINWGAEASGNDFTAGYFAINITYRTNS